MNKKLIKKLDEAGFPAVTRWEVENNSRRPVMVTGESLPPLGALLSEIKVQIGLEKLGEAVYSAYILEKGDENYNDEWSYKNISAEPMEESYRDDKIFFLFKGSTPEEAVAKLWLKLNER